MWPASSPNSGPPRSWREPLLVEGVVQRDPHVRVVERRVREVHLDVADRVRRVRVDLILQLGIAGVLADLRRGRHAVVDHVELARVHLQREVVRVATDHNLDAIHVPLTQVVAVGVVRRVANQHDRTSHVVSRDRILVIGRQREVELVGPLEHVRAGADQEPSVVVVVTGGDAERSIGIAGERWDGRRGRHRHPERQVPRGRARADDERRVVGRLEPADRVGLARRELAEALGWSSRSCSPPSSIRRRPRAPSLG